ncbi:MAG: hypothetical protein OXE41_01470 [Gammaproteobacteria bacterium]|nr:hypothetical protein [Gammaproteobacteria bacterium]MCY4274060.1 hypothetical protein [Gammaproteobacteria bacterium]
MCRLPICTKKIHLTLATALLTLMVALPSQASGISVTEGETANFQITVHPRHSGHPFSQVRIWYETVDGTAVNGTDYQGTYPWDNKSVKGAIGQPLKISVRTFEDNDIEGSETFKIRIKRLEVGRHWNPWQFGWINTTISSWKINGQMTATITDKYQGGCGSNAGGC